MGAWKEGNSVNNSHSSMELSLGWYQNKETMNNDYYHIMLLLSNMHLSVSFLRWLPSIILLYFSICAHPVWYPLPLMLLMHVSYFSRSFTYYNFQNNNNCSYFSFLPTQLGLEGWRREKMNDAPTWPQVSKFLNYWNLNFSVEPIKLNMA